MLVRELIELLHRCPQDATVGYDIENAFKNDESERVYGFDRENSPSEFYMGIDDVLIGEGTNKGFVFLTEDENQKEVQNMRLIDSDAEVERLQKDYCEECTRKGNYGIFGAACTPCWVMDAVEEFENAQTVEAEPVRHWQWIAVRNIYGETKFSCSRCGHYIRSGMDKNYCPNCGSKNVLR